MRIGSGTIAALKLGSTTVNRAYLGSAMVYDAAPATQATSTLYAVSHVTGNVNTPANALGAPDGVYTQDFNTQTSWTSRWRMDMVAAGASVGTHSVTIRARKGSNSANPTINSVRLFQGDTVVATLTLTSGSTTISSSTSQDLVYEFAGSLLSGIAAVDIEIATTGLGGNPSTRNAVAIDAITWSATYEEL